MSAAARLNLAEFRADESWKTAGRLFQDACCAFAKEMASRDAAGRFAHKPTPDEIMLRALPYVRAPKPPEPISGGCGSTDGSAITNRSEVGSCSTRKAEVICDFPAGIKPGPHPSIFTPQRLTNSIFAVLLIALMFVDPVLIIKIGAGLYGLANGLVAWEGK